MASVPLIPGLGSLVSVPPIDLSVEMRQNSEESSIDKSMAGKKLIIYRQMHRDSNVDLYHASAERLMQVRERLWRLNIGCRAMDIANVWHNFGAFMTKDCMRSRNVQGCFLKRASMPRCVLGDACCQTC